MGAMAVEDISELVSIFSDWNCLMIFHS